MKLVQSADANIVMYRMKKNEMEIVCIYVC